MHQFRDQIMVRLKRTLQILAGRVSPTPFPPPWAATIYGACQPAGQNQMPAGCRPATRRADPLRGCPSARRPRKPPAPPARNSVPGPPGADQPSEACPRPGLLRHAYTTGARAARGVSIYQWSAIAAPHALRR